MPNHRLNSADIKKIKGSLEVDAMTFISLEYVIGDSEPREAHHTQRKRAGVIPLLPGSKAGMESAKFCGLFIAFKGLE
ncbi:MAG TPA: hypothetical protein VIM59_10115 [Cellvibrio sp.]